MEQTAKGAAAATAARYALGATQKGAGLVGVITTAMSSLYTQYKWTNQYSKRKYIPFHYQLQDRKTGRPVQSSNPYGSKYGMPFAWRKNKWQQSHLPQGRTQIKKYGYWQTIADPAMLSKKRSARQGKLKWKRSSQYSMYNCKWRKIRSKSNWKFTASQKKRKREKTIHCY